MRKNTHQKNASLWGHAYKSVKKNINNFSPRNLSPLSLLPFFPAVTQAASSLLLNNANNTAHFMISTGENFCASSRAVQYLINTNGFDHCDLFSSNISQGIYNQTLLAIENTSHCQSFLYQAFNENAQNFTENCLKNLLMYTTMHFDMGKEYKFVQGLYIFLFMAMMFFGIVLKLTTHAGFSQNPSANANIRNNSRSSVNSILLEENDSDNESNMNSIELETIKTNSISTDKPELEITTEGSIQPTPAL